MFGNIKRKFNDVIQERLLAPGNASTSYLNTDSQIETGISLPSGLNPYAGCNLIQKNEEIWQEIHETNEINADLANQADKKIKQIKENAEKINAELKDLNFYLSQIPLIENDVKNCLDNMITFKKLSESFNKKLVNLENSYEELELKNKIMDRKSETIKYKKEKINQLENGRLAIAAQHVENVKKYEESLKKLQAERQKVFEEAFESDLQEFKTKGSVPKVEHIKKDASVMQLSLEDIDLNTNNDNQDLELFLNN